ncbi:MAG: hypothetical protein QNJ00_01130 [Woeseiaceae bacterium]|nr:hypothetical protein [Woeseiaceae bacterium]
MKRLPGLLAKLVGMLEVLFALFAAFLGFSLLVGMFRGDRFAGEWGLLLAPMELTVAATFGWAGYQLLRREVWKHQLVPLAAVILIGAFSIWADTV